MEAMISQLKTANENTWMLIGAVSEQISSPDDAAKAFDRALKHNPNSILALNAAANLARSRDKFDEAVDLFQRILNIKQDNGEVWGSMGHCLLMKDDLPKAYTAYQQALHYLPNPKEPKLWYGIGILYDRYGSFEHAEEAFSSVLKMDPGGLGCKSCTNSRL
jgi:tetratricopeptide (TPR) repeat protein